MLIDIGLNLASNRFDDDRAEVLARARAAGVTGFVLTGTSLQESREVIALARQHPGCYTTVGVHPHSASEVDAFVLDELGQLLASPEVVAVGETGLDFNRNYSPPDAQERAFVAHIELAARTGLPLFLHERDASHRLQDILNAHRHDWKSGVLHCFTGSRDSLFHYLDMGLMIGITGWICDERRGHELQTLVKLIPDDRLLLETDAPWLLPRDMPGPPRNRRNEPAFLPHIAQTVARLRQQSPAYVATITGENARRLFRLPAQVPED